MNRRNENAWARSGRRIATLAIVVAGTLLSACVSHIDQLREAERTFSRAAEMENRERYGEAQVARAVDSYTASYQVVARGLDRLIRERTSDLRSDNLLCTAYTLQALSLWRIHDREAAVRQARAGLATACVEGAPGAVRAVTPRDRALLVALPGLAAIDESNELLVRADHAAPAAARMSAYHRIRDNIDAAGRHLDDAERPLAADHPIRAYFGLSRMGAARIRTQAVQKLVFGPEVTAERDVEFKASAEAARGAWEQYRRLLHCRAPAGEDPARVKEGLDGWRRALGLSGESPEPRC